MAFGPRKGGSSRARSQRAKAAHARRKAKPFATTRGHAPYKGHATHRTKRAWIW